jgi:hypothetical protein
MILMSKSSLRCFAIAVLLLALGSLNGEVAADLKKVQDFEIEGVALWECQCPAYGCPCQRNGRPTHGTCHGSDFAHISKGHYGSVRLDGFNVVMVGNLVDANSHRLFATLYLDNKATEEQSDALTRIVEYMNGAYVALAEQPPVPFSRVKRVPIMFDESADRTHYSLEIPAILQEQAVLKRDKSGKPMSTMTAMDMWSNTVHNADNLKFEYHDPEVETSWDHSGNYANLKYFTLTRQMYTDQKMLGQHGDMSGSWTPKQLEIIRNQGLKEK